MLLIECFTAAHVDNIAACLRLCPEKVVMVGDGEKMAGPVKAYRKLLEKRGMKTRLETRDVRGMDIREVCGIFEELIQGAGDCVIDLTGGDESVILAAGAALAGLNDRQRKHLRVEKFDHKRDAVVDCLRGNREIPSEPVNLTVAEIVELHGGCIYQQTFQPSEDFRKSQLEPLWELVAQDPKRWNRTLKTMNGFESRADSKTQVYLWLDHLRGTMADFDDNEADMRQLLEVLHNKGVLNNRSSAKALEYNYTSPEFRFCTEKAGNVLEMKTLLEGREVADGNQSLFQDGMMSVCIDWDGVPNGSTADTRNEIDVVFMRGTTPLFVSCKNGEVPEEEVYKLNTVADRFGGPYAKKLLVVTDLKKKNGEPDLAFERRAKDMGIALETDAGELTAQGWQDIFRKAMQ